MNSQVAFLLLLMVASAAARAPEDGYSREQLQPLTQFRHVSAHILKCCLQRVECWFQAAAPKNH